MVVIDPRNLPSMVSMSRLLVGSSNNKMCGAWNIGGHVVRGLCIVVFVICLHSDYLPVN